MPESSTGSLLNIAPDQIERNPENPRLFFRTGELESLLASIHEFGIQVPLSVYRDGHKYILIDGERRWRCASKLNLKSVPAIVQAKPNPLENLLLMFNIHALREQWDYFTIANKLPRVRALFKEKHARYPNEAELSQATGLSRGQVRRCDLLLELPESYRALLLADLELPKHEHTLSEDFLLEMERALKTVRERLPGAVGSNLDKARDALIGKYRSGVIKNITDFRKLRKIATSVQALGVDKDRAEAAVKRILNPKEQIGVVEVFEQGFGDRYDDRRALLSAESLLEFLRAAPDGKVSVRLRQALSELDTVIRRLPR